MDWLPLIIGIFIVILVLDFLSRALKKKPKKNSRNKIKDFKDTYNMNEDDENVSDVYPYKRKDLLTKNEWYFHKSLKEIAEKHNLHILAKVRLADVVDVDKNKTKEYMKYFGKIKSKHIDFLLVKKDNLLPLLAIEVDDNSHNSKDRIQRDMLVNNIFETIKLPLLRVSGSGELEQKICEKLNIQTTLTNNVVS